MKDPQDETLYNFFFSITKREREREREREKDKIVFGYTQMVTAEIDDGDLFFAQRVELERA